MKVKELRERVAEAGGELVLGKLSICRGIDELAFNVAGIYSAWMNDSCSGDAEVADKITVSGSNILRNLVTWVEFAQFIGIEVGEIKPITIEKTVQVNADRSTEHHLAGKVEAYEKLLIGRGVNITT